VATDDEPGEEVERTRHQEPGNIGSPAPALHHGVESGDHAFDQFVLAPELIAAVKGPHR
jgi:hypothetical protein